MERQGRYRIHALNEYRKSGELEGLLMSNPSVPAGDPLQGSFALAALTRDHAAISYWRGWPQGRWWNSPMLFWDVFSRDGQVAERTRAPQCGGSGLSAKLDTCRRIGKLHLSAVVEFSQSHP